MWNFIQCICWLIIKVIDAQFFFLYLFIPILYMFRSTKCSSSGESIVSIWPLVEWDGLGMWRVCVRRGGCIRSWWGNRRERDHWGDLGVDGWIILGWISRRWDVDWIRLTQDRDRWRTLVSTVMNLRVPRNAGNFLTSCKPVSFSRRTLHHGVSK